MAKRNRAAISVIDGAVNPVAIVNAIREAYAEIQNEPGFQGTQSYTNDPAVRLMIHQLAYISGVISTVHDWPEREKPQFGQAYESCQRAVQEPAQRTIEEIADAHGGLA